MRPFELLAVPEGIPEVERYLPYLLCHIVTAGLPQGVPVQPLSLGWFLALPSKVGQAQARHE